VYTIALSAQGGLFEGSMALSCSGNPPGTACNFDQEQVTLVSGQASVTMTVTTVAPAGSAPLGTHGAPRELSFPLVYALLVLTALLASAALNGMTPVNPTAGGGRLGGSVVRGILVTAFLVVPVSCGDDGTNPPTGGTPPGSYDLTVTAAWETVQLTTTVTMVVQ
jgi:hypothetical protein